MARQTQRDEWRAGAENARRVREWNDEREAILAVIYRERPFLMGYDALMEADAILNLLHDHGYKIVKENT